MAASDNGAVRDQSRRAARAARLKKRRAARAAQLKNLAALLKSLGNIVIILSALGVLFVALWSLRDVLHPRPVAAAFTRVGGTTRVETALEAARFWLTPPQCVVMTEASASQDTMFAAAWYAMIHDAPLLFTSRDRMRQQLVNATMADWRAAAGDQKQVDTITFNAPDDMKGRCEAKADPADVNGLSTLAVPNQPIQLPHVAAQDTLAPMVVFAAAIEPTDPPDIAVGMALAAHMARADREKVSLVVVPHYLESDPELEMTLERQHKLVTGGVVLGQTPTIPEDTRVLLRELLTSIDQMGLLAQVQASLTSLGAFITVLLPVFGAGVAVRAAPEIGHQAVELVHQLAGPGQRVAELTRHVTEGARRQLRSARQQLRKGWESVMNPPPPAPDSWPPLPDDIGEKAVTVWLRSGWKLTGTVTSQDGSDAKQSRNRAARTMSRLRLNAATLAHGEDQTVLTAEFVMVPVADIELIGVNVQEPVNPPS